MFSSLGCLNFLKLITDVIRYLHCLSHITKCNLFLTKSLDEYWQNHPELHDIPIYYASSLAKKCMAVYQTYVNAMNDKIRKQININNPFVFKHISNLKVSAEGEEGRVNRRSTARWFQGWECFLLRSHLACSRHHFSARKQKFSNWHSSLLKSCNLSQVSFHSQNFLLVNKLGLSAVEIKFRWEKYLSWRLRFFYSYSNLIIFLICTVNSRYENFHVYFSRAQ